jgi:hypothetical protein
MSVYPIPTNFSGLISPRGMQTTIFSTTGTGAAMGSTTANLQGYLGAGSVIVGAYLKSGSASGVTYTASITGAYSAYGGTVATFSGVTPATIGAAYGVPITQDSYIVITSTSSSALLPSAIITYL